MNVHSVKQFSYTVGNSVVHYSFYQLAYQVPNAQEDQKQQLSTEEITQVHFYDLMKYVTS